MRQIFLKMITSNVAQEFPSYKEIIFIEFMVNKLMNHCSSLKAILTKRLRTSFEWILCNTSIGYSMDSNEEVITNIPSVDDKKGFIRWSAITDQCIA
jgi:hypothetical protein